jgi:hypothetical protein
MGTPVRTPALPLKGKAQPSLFHSDRLSKQDTPGSILRPKQHYFHEMHKFFSVSAWLVGAASLAFVSYVCFRYLMPEAPPSPVVLFASYDSGVGGTLLEFRADGTFRYENAAFISSDTVTGHYTRTGDLIRLDRLPKTGLLKSKTLQVRAAPHTETGNGLWQVGSADDAKLKLAVFTVFRPAPAR